MNANIETSKRKGIFIATGYALQLPSDGKRTRCVATSRIKSDAIDEVRCELERQGYTVDEVHTVQFFVV